MKYRLLFASAALVACSNGAPAPSALACEEASANASFQRPPKGDDALPTTDGSAFVAGLEYATGVEATVLGKPSPSYFAAALDALDAEPELTWLVTDDVEADVRGARLFGMRTAVVRTGKFRPETLESTDASPDIIVSSLAQFPALLEQDLSGGLAR